MSIQKDFLEISQKIDNLLKTMSQLSVKASSYTVYMGPTGSGKSCLTNYMHNVKLQFKKQPGGLYDITQVENPENCPKIGNQKKSCTQIPNICQINGSSSADLVGWFQSRGQLQEIINSFSNASVLIKGKRVKIVLVCQTATFDSRGGLLADMLNILSDVFQQDLQKIQDSILVVFSKVNTDKWDEATILQQMTEVAKKNQNLNVNSSKLLTNIIKKERIGIFPTPNKITNHIQMIKKKISSMSETVLVNNANISLTQKAISLKNQFQTILVKNSKTFALSYQQIINLAFDKKHNTSGLVTNAINSLNQIKNLSQAMINANGNEQLQTSTLINLNGQLKPSNQLVQKVTNHIKMIQFIRKMNKNFNQFKSFAQMIQSHIVSCVKNLENQKSALVIAQEKKAFEEKQRIQKEKRDAEALRIKLQNQAKAKKLQQQKQEAAKKQRDRLQNQRIQRQKKLKQDQQNARIALQRARNTPVQRQYVHHHHSGGGGCIIM